MKYTFEFKLECIRRKEVGEPLPMLSECNKNTLRRRVLHWQRIYENYGIEGLRHNKKPLMHNEILTAVNRVVNGESCTSVAASIGRTTTAVSKWVKIYLQNGIDGIKLLKRGRKTMPKNSKNTNKQTNISEVRKSKYTDEEIEYILAENAYLKKLNALVQEENQKQTKK